MPPFPKDLSEERRAAIRYLGGHSPFGKQEKFFSGRTALYFALMREPYERVRSFYNRVVTRPDHVSHEKCRNMSFVEFLEHHPAKWIPLGGKR